MCVSFRGFILSLQYCSLNRPIYNLKVDIYTQYIVINQWGNTWRRLLNCANQHWKSWLSLVIRLLINNTYYISRYCVSYFSQNRVKLNILTKCVLHEVFHRKMPPSYQYLPNEYCMSLILLKNYSNLPIYLPKFVLHEFYLTQKLFQLTDTYRKLSTSLQTGRFAQTMDNVRVLRFSLGLTVCPYCPYCYSFSQQWFWKATNFQCR